MEASSEVRRLHVIYFLSRNGCIEHPHLVRVHHQTRNGVKLRDIKRWLGELRGNDMPDSFSWSYKRKYRTGYVWQDLLDDDLINPISDNEYVLKGSGLINSYSSSECDVRSTPHQKQHPVTTQPQQSSQSSSEIEEESPTVNSETSTVTTDDSVVKVDYQTNMNKNKNENQNQMRSDTTALDKISSSSAAKGLSSKSNVFRNLITCGGVDTNDSAHQVVRLNKHNKSNKNNNRPFLKNIASPTDLGFGDNSLGGSHRVFGNPTWAQQHHNCNARKSFDGVKVYSSSPTKSKIDEQGDKNKAPCAAYYYPVNGPTCSQCGKTFRPEKLHSHMKSCKGMKALPKTAAGSGSDKASKGGDAESRRNRDLSVN